MTLIVETPDSRPAERDYIFRTLLGEFLGLEWIHQPGDRGDVRITMAEHPDTELRLPDVLLSTPPEIWLTPQSLPRQPLSIWDTTDLGQDINLVDSKLPVIYGDIEPRARWQEGTVYLPLDVPGSALFMLTRYEEVVKAERDEHERFPAHASLAFQEGFLLRPIVDEYTEVLWAALRTLWPRMSRRKRKYEVVLTHDADRPFGVKGESWRRVARRFGGDVIRRKSLGMAAKRLGSFLLPGRVGESLDPNNTFEWIMKQSERRGVRSEFYFMAGKTSSYDSGYDLYSPRLQRLLRHIFDRGHVIGLHPSYGTLGRPDLIASEAATLRGALDKAGVPQPIRGGRQHYLRWRADQTWADWEAAGLEEDSSVGFAEHIGFRAGTCHRYPTWSWADGEPLCLTERPLIAMEVSLLSKKYMALDSEQSVVLLNELTATAKRMGGDCVFLWHNDTLASKPFRELYRNVLM